MLNAATINALFGDLRHLLDSRYEPHRVDEWQRRFDGVVAGFEELRTRERDKQDIDSVLHQRCRQAADDPHPLVSIVAHLLALQFHRLAQPAERQSQCYAWSWKNRQPPCPDLPFLRYGLAHQILNSPEFADREGRDWGYFVWQRVAELLDASKKDDQSDTPPPGLASSDAPALLKLHRQYKERTLQPNDPVLDLNRDKWRGAYALFPVLEAEWGVVPKRPSVLKKIWERVFEPIAALIFASAGWRYFWYVLWETRWGYLTRFVVILIALGVPVATYILWGYLNKDWIREVLQSTWR